LRIVLKLIFNIDHLVLSV